MAGVGGTSGGLGASGGRGDPGGHEDRPATVQEARSRRRRREILEVASATFATRGFHQASLAEIAFEAGITAAGLLHHFKTKDQLLTELLRSRDLEGIEDARRAARSGDLVGLGFLRHLVETAARNATQPAITQLYTVLSAEAVTADHPAQAWFRSRYAGLREMVARALAEARDLGELRDDADVQETAAAVVAVMDGLQIQWLLDQDSVDMASATRRTIDALVASLAPDAAGPGAPGPGAPGPGALPPGAPSQVTP